MPGYAGSLRCMITATLLMLALVALGILGCLLVLTWSCLAAAVEFCADRFRKPATEPPAAGTGC
jgi:hypothetical protein